MQRKVAIAVLLALRVAFVWAFWQLGTVCVLQQTRDSSMSDQRL